MRSFHQGIRIRTNLIDVDEHGHWKVNFLHKWVEEKGLDTSLAVDMVALQDNYDVAVVMSGDADNIPSIRQCNKATTRRAPPASAGGSSGIRVGMSAGLIGAQVKAAEVEVDGLAETLTAPKARGLFLEPLDA